MKLSEDDLGLVKFTEAQIHNLSIEVKTLQGFLAHYIQSRYHITEQGVFDKLLKGEEVLIPASESTLPQADRSLELVKS